MKRFAIRVLAGLPVLLLFLPHGSTADPRAWADPFQISVVDEQTGRGLDHVRLTSDNGLVCYTRPDGTTPWTESSLMDRSVSFRIEMSGSERTVSVYVVPGGRAVISMAR